MKAMVAPRPMEMEMVDRDIPEPKAGEVLVRIRAVGICGSDVHAFGGHHPVVTFPRILGHEMAGEIVQVGPEVKERRSGERVVVEPATACDQCYSCRIDFFHNCCNLEFKGVHVDGGYQEYLSIPEQNVYPVPSDMPFTMAALAEPLGIGLESAKIAQLIPGDTVAILGAGPIGLACLLAVKRNNHPVIITDIQDSCLKRAEALGVNRAVNVKQSDMIDAVMDFTDQLGANVVMECAGAAANFKPALEAASVCGRIVVCGLIFDEVSYVPYIQIKKHLHLLGTRNSNMIPEAIELLKERGEEIEKVFVTHRLPLEEAEKGLRMVNDPGIDTCKVMLNL